MSEEPKLDAAKRPSGLRAMADGLIFQAGRTGVETANVWQTADILRSAADEIERLRKQCDEAREEIKLLRVSGIEKVTHGNQTVSATANIPVTSTSAAKDPRCPYCGKPVIGSEFVQGNEGRYHKACTQPDYQPHIPTYPLNVPTYTPVYPKPIDVWCGTSITRANDGGAK